MTNNLAERQDTAIADPIQTAYDELQDISYRRILSPQALSPVLSLRWLTRNGGKTLSTDLDDHPMDDFDEARDTHNFGIFHQDRLVSAIRLHKVTLDNDTPGRRHSGATLDALIESGASMIEVSQLAVDPSCVRTLPKLPFYTMRLVVMAAENFRPQNIVMVAKTSQAAFLKRFFDFTPLRQAGASTGLDESLFVARAPDLINSAEKYMPFMKSLASERLAIFRRIDLGPGHIANSNSFLPLLKNS